MKPNKFLKEIYDWSLVEIKDILDVYINNVYDPAGGFYGAMSRELVAVKDADRSLVLNARLLWTFASAYRVVQDRRYLDMALHAFDYVSKYFVDHEYGGAYWSVHADGTPADDTKYVYGISFVIYGAAELVRALRDVGAGDAAGNGAGRAFDADKIEAEALALAQKMFNDLEEHALDKVNNGYFETFTREWARRNDSFNIKDPSLGSKALNTHLHLIESYTNLMRVDGSPDVREKVGSFIDIMTTKLLDTDCFHYKPYMTDDWRAVETLYSYGHDIEGSWLLTEALEAYGDEGLTEEHKLTTLWIVRACEDGIVSDDENPARVDGMIYEADEKGNPVDPKVAFWPQVEAAVGYFNAYQISDDEYFMQLTLRFIDFIKKNLSDREGGVFREYLPYADFGPRGKQNEMRVHAWKGPYHNGRMCLEFIERIRKIPGAVY